MNQTFYISSNILEVGKPISWNVNEKRDGKLYQVRATEVTLKEAKRIKKLLEKENAQ